MKWFTTLFGESNSYLSAIYIQLLPPCYIHPTPTSVLYTSDSYLRVIYIQLLPQCYIHPTPTSVLYTSNCYLSVLHIQLLHLCYIHPTPTSVLYTYPQALDSNEYGTISCFDWHPYALITKRTVNTVVLGHSELLFLKPV